MLTYRDDKSPGRGELAARDHTVRVRHLEELQRSNPPAGAEHRAHVQ